MTTNSEHTPVMAAEALDALHAVPGTWVVDATLGFGGHTKALLNKGVNVIGFDWDKESITYNSEKFASEIEQHKVILIHDTFARLEHHVHALTVSEKISSLSGVLFDFGTSSHQLMSESRGFSFQGDGPLDMRMDTRKQVQAKDILAAASERELRDIFQELGGERHARAIAKAVKRSHEPIVTTGQLTALVESVTGRKRGHLHPATKVFQALRIVVNSELEEISQALPQALSCLKHGGSLVTIAFHEGEDRIVKTLFKQWEREGKGTMEPKKPVFPSEAEVQSNPRARSARLRSFYVTQ